MPDVLSGCCPVSAPGAALCRAGPQTAGSVLGLPPSLLAGRDAPVPCGRAGQLGAVPGLRSVCRNQRCGRVVRRFGRRRRRWWAREANRRGSGLLCSSHLSPPSLLHPFCLLPFPPIPMISPSTFQLYSPPPFLIPLPFSTPLAPSPSSFISLPLFI